MTTIPQSSMSQAAKLLAKMSEMRHSQTLTDVSLKVGEKVFHAHRVVLAASCDYFCAMFSAGMRESFDEVVELKDSSVTPESLEIILDSVYKSVLNVTKKNVLDVLVAADHLQMTDVTEQCSKFISEKIVNEQLNKFDIRSLQEVLNVAERHSLLDLQEEVYSRMAIVFKELSETQEFLNLVSVSQLLYLLQRNDVTVPSETFVFRLVVKWINHDMNKRLGHAATLFRAVRLGLVDIRVLITELRRGDLRGDKECWNILHEALLYNNMPALLPELTLIKTEPRTTSPVLIAIEMESPLKFYDVTKQVWVEFEEDVPIMEKCLAMTSHGDCIYIGGTQRVYRYSINSNAWDELPSMNKSKDGFPYQLIVLGEYLYATGNDPERYSFREKTWQTIAPLPIKSSRSQKGAQMWTAAADFGGCIYAVGFSNTWRFDESENKWVRKSNNLNTRVSCFAFGYKGKLIIAGGKIYNPGTGFFSFPKTVETYCKESGHWAEVEQRHSFSFPFSKRAFEVDNKVFIKLNNFVFDCGVKVSPDDIDPVNLYEWENVAKLSPLAVVTYAPVNIKKLLDNSEDG